MSNPFRNFLDWLRNIGHKPSDRLREVHIRNPESDNSEGQVTEPKQYKEIYRQTPNYNNDREITPTAVVLHHTSGSYAGSVDWCLRKESQVSYHCIIKRDGERTILASDNQRTWHAGKSFWRGKHDLNSWALGLAFEGDSYMEPLSLDMINSAIEYLVPRMNKLSITITDITDHRTVSPNRKNDLNPTEYNRVIEALKNHA